MAKLYPPHIEGALPAFCGNTLRIPFVGSRAVSLTGDGVINMVAQFKDIQMSALNKTCRIPVSSVEELSNNTYMISCNPGGSFIPGQHYKLQLAYENAEGIGYFSDVGIIKYIQEPVISIDASGTHKYTYTLTYTCSDSTEKLYSTSFFLAETGTLQGWGSGEIIHNTNKDTGNTATESYDFLQELDVNKNYEIYAIVTTSSGYVMETKHYPIHSKAVIPAINGFGITAKLDYDNGCVNIGGYGTKKSTLTGNFKIARADSKENYSIWHVMTSSYVDASNTSETDPQTLWRDFTVEQGQNYKYALYFTDDKNNLSDKVETNTLYVDFEDSFLFDGEKQLCIRFNPKVSNFKTTVQETKTDTIGGQYPFIQRNGNTNYKELSISGLISHLSDPLGYFDNNIAQIKEIDNETGLERNYNTNLNGENVALERKFKLAALDWLNNGKPKLFRSPTEGNYLVRLLNVSLSPTDTLGRMLHSFSATAYEIDEATPEVLIKESYKILRPQSLSGIVDFNSEKGVVSYPLNQLSSGIDLISAKSELKGKKILGAWFYHQYNPTHTLNVKINGTDINVYTNDKYENEIVSLKKGDNGFSPGANDSVVLSYQNVLSLSAINDRVEKANSQNTMGQYYGFDLLNLFSGLKNFVQQIYKLICSTRRILSVILDAAEWTFEKLQELLNLFNMNPNGTFTFGDITKTALEWIKQLIKDKTHFDITESCLYKFVINNTGTGQTICGFFDACANRVLTTIQNGVQKLLTTQQDSCLTYIFETAQNIENKITNKLTVYASDLPNNLKNLIANPFTCVEMFFRKQENEISATWISESMNQSLSLLDSYVGGNSLYGLTTEVMGGLKSSISLGCPLVSSCESLVNNFESLLSEGKILTSTGNGVLETANTILNNSTNTNISGVVEKTASTVTSLASAAISSFSGTNEAAITDISRTVLVGSINALKGLFGGLC